MAGLSPEQRAELARPDGPGDGRHGAGQRDGAPARRAAPGPARPAVGPARAGARRRAGPGPGRRDHAPSPSWPTSRRCPTSSRRATPARRWPTSTRSCSSGRWAARPSTTWPRCASWSASWSGRATSTARDGQAGALPQGGAPARAPPRCAGCSPSSTPTGRGEHDVADAGAAGRAHRQLAGVAVRRRAAAGRRPHGQERRPADGAASRRSRATTGACGSPSTTSRWWRPSGAPAPPSRCWSTCPTRWRCAARGARPSRRRWRCTRW